jgi:hypothetical protein
MANHSALKELLLTNKNIGIIISQNGIGYECLWHNGNERLLSESYLTKGFVNKGLQVNLKP